MSGMSTLILETSSPHASLAIVGVDGSTDERAFCSDRKHNARLFGPLEELLAPLAQGDIGLVLVGSGPGSYSGTRVGIAAAQGVAIVNDCQVVAVASLLAVPAAIDGGTCLVIGDARRGCYWTARVADCRMEAEPGLTDAAGLVAAVAVAVAQGVAVVAFEEPGRFPLPGELAAQVQQEFPSAARLWRAWCMAGEDAQAAWACAAPQPIYLKPPHISTPAQRAWLLPN
jgi:tRNA threonylcarbamoyladenosine biosynthesis protein TsaB